jgi:hypothetical protein
MPLREFWRRFIVLGGYRDHAYGLLFCGLMGWYTFVTYWKLRRLGAGYATAQNEQEARLPPADPARDWL